MFDNQCLYNFIVRISTYLQIALEHIGRVVRMSASGYRG